MANNNEDEKLKLIMKSYEGGDDGEEDGTIPEYNLGFVILIAIIGSVGGFIFGYDIGIIGGA